MKIRLLAVVPFALALFFPPASSSSSLLALRAREARQERNLARYEGTVRFYRARPWLLRYGRPSIRSFRRADFRRAKRHVSWRRLELEQTRAALAPPIPHLSAWLCIHSYEGAWDDSGDPYWGGLQFGAGEWSRYGGRFAPTANLATPREQMLAAEAYWNVSGFRPWPRTARYCGLL